MAELPLPGADLSSLRAWLQGLQGRLSEAPEVLGLGFDIEEVARWEQPLKLDMLFTPSERRYCEAKSSPARHYAGLWCAKEAAFKAVSGHISVNLREMEVVHELSGAPRMVFLTAASGPVADRLQISITHTQSLAAALAVYVHQDSGDVAEIEALLCQGDLGSNST